MAVQALKPRVDLIKERFGDDKDKVQKETSVLYEQVRTAATPWHPDSYLAVTAVPQRHGCCTAAVVGLVPTWGGHRVPPLCRLLRRRGGLDCRGAGARRAPLASTRRALSGATHPTPPPQHKSSVLTTALQPRRRGPLPKPHRSPHPSPCPTPSRPQAGVNPLAGCLPTLATIPIFIALYSSLTNVANDGLLDTQGFYFIPSLAGGWGAGRGPL